METFENYTGEILELMKQRRLQKTTEKNIRINGNYNKAKNKSGQKKMDGG